MPPQRGSSPSLRKSINIKKVRRFCLREKKKETFFALSTTVICNSTAFVKRFWKIVTKFWERGGVHQIPTIRAYILLRRTGSIFTKKFYKLPKND